MNILSKKILSLILATCFVISSMPITVFASQNTWDPANGVFEISTVEDFFSFRDTMDDNNSEQYNYFEDITIKLMNDLDFNGSTYITPKQDGSVFSAFIGAFDGQNHTIKNLVVRSASGQNNTGLFSVLYYGSVKNLTVENIDISNASKYSAVFAPQAFEYCSFENCHIKGNTIVSTDKSRSGATFAGGFVGYNYANVSFENCSIDNGTTIDCRTNTAFDTTQGRRMAAGFVAYTNKVTYENQYYHDYARKTSDFNDMSIVINNCTNGADIFSNDEASGFVGYVDAGVPSKNTDIRITNCANYGNVTIGKNDAKGINCSAGILSSTTYFSTVEIDRCRNYGDITTYGTTSASTAGIIGEINSGSVKNSFNCGKITAEQGNTSLGGIIGQARTDTYGSPITISQYDSTYNNNSNQYYLPQQYNQIVNCFNTGDVVVINENSNVYTGGVCGYLNDDETQVKHSVLKNAYNFGNVSGGSYTGDVVGNLYHTEISNIYAKQSTDAIGGIMEVPNSYVSRPGYYDSANIGGKVYPATFTSTNETISDTPLDTDLKDTLDKFVDDENATLKNDGDSFRYLPWTYSDGNDGQGVHPVFGYDIINNAPEIDKAENGGYLTTSKYGYEYYKLKSDSDKTVSVAVHNNDGSTLKSISAVDQDGNTVALTDRGNGIYTFSMPEADVTINAEWDKGEVKPNNTVYLTTKDSVDINFVVDADYYTKDPNATVILNYNFQNRNYERDFKTTEVPLNSIEKTEDGRYKFTIKSAPAQLTEPIKIVLKDSTGKELYKVDYSMWDYCDEIIKNDISIHETVADPDEIKNWDKAAALCESLIDYATTAQMYFEYNNDKEDMMSDKAVVERAEALGKSSYTDSFTGRKYFGNVCGVDKSEIKSAGAAANIDGVLPFEIGETSLMSLSNTEVRFYFDEKSVNPADYNVSVTTDNWYGKAKPIAAFGTSNSGSFITVGGIESTNLDNVFHLTIRNKLTGDTATINYNALAYCFTVLRSIENSDDAKLKELCSLVKAIYLYNRAAQNYFVNE